MSEDLLDTLLEYIDARIDEKITEAIGRDSANEYLKRLKIEQELRAMFREK